MNGETNNKKDESLITVIVTGFVVIAILVLAFLFYYFATKQSSYGEIQVASISGAVNVVPKKSLENSTKVIQFAVPETLPSTIKSGECWTNSIAEPYREDAWRCMVDDSIYDPCFAMEPKGFVFYPLNPLNEEAFLIEFTKPLPEVEIPVKKQDNWAWFVKLKDGTYCSPFTGTRVFVGQDIAYYSCNSSVEGETAVLMGDLISGNIWKATKAVIEQVDKKWIIKSSQEVEVDTVWQ
jgi:hypothetical protein